MQMDRSIHRTSTKCLEKCENQNDFVFASRYSLNGKTDDDTFLTFLGNKIFTTIGNIFFWIKNT